MWKRYKVWWDFIFYQHITAYINSAERVFKISEKGNIGPLLHHREGWVYFIIEKDELLGFPRERESGTFIPLKEDEEGICSRSEPMPNS